MKLGAWPGFRLPDVGNLTPWLRARPALEQLLDATYLDAPDLRLVRAGVTLRHRAGEGGEGRWTLKIPHPANPDRLERTELTEDGPPGLPPPALLGAVRGLLRGAEPHPIARLQTRRRLVALVDGGGRALGEVADDEVSVIEGDRVAARFREVEVEAAPGAPDSLLPLLVERLRLAGAGEPDPTPKLVRALGPRALLPPDPIVPPLGPEPSAAAAVQAALAASVQRLLGHDPVVRLDLGAFGVHQARVSTRRLRSDLKTFEPLVDPAWAAGLREQLAWLAGALGSVRDADVMGQRLRKAAERLGGADGPQAVRLLKRLERERDHHLAELHALFDGTDYLSLLDRLVGAVRDPAFLPVAEGPAAVVLPELVRRPWKRLRRDADRLGKGATDEQLHELRIRTKRARYAAEAVVRAVPEAALLAEALAELQGVLGDQHDAVVAEGWLRGAVAAGCSRQQAMAAGLLIAAERQDATEHRDAWRAMWAKADRKKARAWLD